MDPQRTDPQEAAPMPVRFRAIVLGISFYTILIVAAQTILYSLVLGPKASAMTEDEVMRILNESEWTQVYEWVFGPLLTLISGYICGLYAKERMTHHGFIMGMIITLSCFSVFAAQSSTMGASAFGNPATDLASFLLIIPMATLGGWLASKSSAKLKV